MADRILGCLADVGNGIVEQGGDPEHVERVMPAIEGNTRMAGVTAVSFVADISNRC